MSALSSKKQRALVIGSSGGIAQAVVKALLEEDEYENIYTVSRSADVLNDERIKHFQVNSEDESEVQAVCHQFQDEGVFSLIICCIGTLHGGEGDKQFRPEKRLESLNTQSMLRYFQVNTLAPMNWLKNIVTLVPKDQTSHVVFFTARVASIEDNYLGGWYGYRASKAALNMLIKTAQVELARRSPKAILVSYHPGTVDTKLSKPFQKNVPEKKLFQPEFTVAQLLSLLPTLTPDSAPHYIDWQGKTIPW